jgi:hypothetical protein
VVGTILLIEAAMLAILAVNSDGAQHLNGISTIGLLGWDGETWRLVFDAFRDAQPPW